MLPSLTCVPELLVHGFRMLVGFMVAGSGLFSGFLRALRILTPMGSQVFRGVYTPSRGMRDVSNGLSGD